MHEHSEDKPFDYVVRRVSSLGIRQATITETAVLELSMYYRNIQETTGLACVFEVDSPYWKTLKAVEDVINMSHRVTFSARLSIGRPLPVFPELCKVGYPQGSTTFQHRPGETLLMVVMNEQRGGNCDSLLQSLQPILYSIFLRPVIFRAVAIWVNLNMIMSRASLHRLENIGRQFEHWWFSDDVGHKHLLMRLLNNENSPLAYLFNP